jgi:hypothetical protein
MRRVILSVDYEIFGNGAGDVRRHIIEPADRMARLCERQQVPLTIFFEAEEYTAFVQHAAALRKDLGYDPAALMREQIIRLIRQGHDVQLHLHPEWFGARYEGRQWLLHPEKKTVDALFETQAEVTEYIASRKRMIEEMAADANSPRAVRAYRAGAFSAQPGRKLLAALAECDIIIDSSVVRGLHGAGSGYDYRTAPCARGPWRVRDDVVVEDSAGPVWEFPISSVMGRRFQQLTPTRLRAKFSSNVPREKKQETVEQFGLRPGDPLGFIRFLGQSVPLKLDYHNVTPNRLMRWIRSAPKPENGGMDVIMLIGHTKEHIQDQGLAKLLQMIGRETDIKVISLDMLARALQPAAVLNH